MSGAINPTGLGLADLLIANTDAVSLQVNKYTEQASTGLVSQSYAGLGQGSSIALNLQPQVTRDTALQTGITNATGPMTVAQDALNQIDTLTTGIIAQIANLNGLSPTAVSSVAASAQSAMQQVAGLLDEQYDGSYVFAGQDSANPPVPDSQNILSTGLYTQINAAVANLATNGASATMSSIQASTASTAAGTSPFSATLESLAAAGNGRTTVETGVGQRVPGVMLANQNGDVQSAALGTPTSGSYFRDILGGLATIASMTSSSLSATDISTVLQQTQTSMTNAISAMGVDQGVLGDRQTQLTDTATALGNTATALGNQVSDVTQVNLAQTATQLSNANTQLQASYQLIANLQKLTLASYL
jgi:flagellar hook-associated protein 3 FlgL